MIQYRLRVYLTFSDTKRLTSTLLNTDQSFFYNIELGEIK